MNAEQEANLLKLAELCENAPYYNQGLVNYSKPEVETGIPCGTPGCAIGQWEAYTKTTLMDVYEVFGLNEDEEEEIFGLKGCDNAGRDGKLAGAYIRDLVARKKAELYER